MSAESGGLPIRVFATCPESSLAEPGTHVRQVAEVARWSEQAGCEGILVYTANYLADAWLISQVIIDHTERLCPLVAVEPVYMSPYSAAKMVASLGFLYGRRVHLNMVAGGFKNDLMALGDTTPHDERYDRLVEYTTIMMELLRSGETGLVTHEGRYYRVKNVRMAPSLPTDLLPGVFVSGSSAAGMAAAQQLGATAVQYPRPAGEYEQKPPADGRSRGIRIGIVARERSAEAWQVARQRFPGDRRGQIAHGLAMKVSDSEWHKQLSQLGESAAGNDNPYWLLPFENYKTLCPYLVGSYARVAEELGRYMALGYSTFILDVVPGPEEMEHIGLVFEAALPHVPNADPAQSDIPAEAKSVSREWASPTSRSRISGPLGVDGPQYERSSEKGP